METEVTETHCDECDAFGPCVSLDLEVCDLDLCEDCLQELVEKVRRWKAANR